MASRRLLCLFFPSLVIDRCQREDPSRRTYPFVVVREDSSHLYIVAANALAVQSGIRPPMLLADARTLAPTLQILLDDAAANARVKQRLTDWCRRYSPLVACDGFGGIVIDITGCTHLFGNEATLLADIEARIHRSGYRVRGAIGDTLGAAWALARYGKHTIVSREGLLGALDPLPVSALRLPQEVIAKLQRLGLSTIAALRRMPRPSLTVRYGPLPVLRLDQAFGYAEEPIAPQYPPASYRSQRILADPINTVSAVTYVLLDLLKELCARMEAANLGARFLQLDCYRVDGTVAQCCIGTSKPVRSTTHIMRLFAEKLEKVDAGFGIETLILSITNVDKLDPAQIPLSRLASPDEEDAALDRLLDRVGVRLGFQEVCRIQVNESWLPESSLKFQSVFAPSNPNAIWPENRVRPVRLINPPISIGVSTMFPDDIPVQFQLGQRSRRILRAEGPERLTPEWWRDNTASIWEQRDYYRIEDDHGHRLWIFREKSPSSSPGEERWFLHGHLP